MILGDEHFEEYIEMQQMIAIQHNELMETIIHTFAAFQTSQQFIQKIMSPCILQNN